MPSKKTLRVTVESLSGDEVDGTAFKKALDEINSQLGRGATSGRFPVSYEYVATGSPETASYIVDWSVRNR